ncbi:MAG: shikimate kinase [Syntrophaceae bacterium]|nr:shikimate kinase [Syntrophaceae bacterium]
MRIVLVGYRGCGKSIVGRLLAERLGLPFLDTDRLIEESAGRTVRQIVDDGGWEEFRTLERRVIAELPEERSVVALGGGAVLDRANVEALEADGFFVWLTAGTDVILERLATDGKTVEQRPPLTEGSGREEVERLLRERLPVYRLVADLAIDTSQRSAAEVAEMIAEYAGRRLSIREACPQSGG